MTTFILVCDDCRVYVSAGRDSRVIYDSAYVGNFLFDHEGHNLRFLNADCDESIDYTQVKWQTDQEEPVDDRYGEWIPE